MDQADFPWQQLGELLVDENLLSQDELERALVEQRRTGRKLGQILVGQGSMTGTELARALAKQHGVELRSRSAEEEWGAEFTLARAEGPWRPLGTVLLDADLVTEDELEEALAEKRVHQDRRLGAILVRLGHISGVTLALALAEQHGIQLDSSGVPDSLRTVAVAGPAEQTEHGLVPKGEGWFVINAHEATWWTSEGRGAYSDLEGEPEFGQVGVHLVALDPGEVMAMYHWEEDQENFMVLSGEAILVIEG